MWPFALIFPYFACNLTFYCPFLFLSSFLPISTFSLSPFYIFSLFPFPFSYFSHKSITYYSWGGGGIFQHLDPWLQWLRTLFSYLAWMQTIRSQDEIFVTYITTFVIIRTLFSSQSINLTKLYHFRDVDEITRWSDI
jgi:hypothetical protein